jgi:hypothetical protein
MFSYLKQLFLFIVIFITFHFTYNYVKSFFSDKKKETDIFEPTKYTNVLNEINDLLEKNTKNPTEELNTQSGYSSSKNDEPESIQSSIIKNHSLEEELTDYMKEIEKEVLTQQDNTKIPVIMRDGDRITGANSVCDDRSE